MFSIGIGIGIGISLIFLGAAEQSILNGMLGS